MAVARHRINAARIPNHMPAAANGAPYEAWMKNVSQRNAPGAIKAMALTVKPVKPKVVGGFKVGVSGDIRYSFSLRAFQIAAVAAVATSAHDTCDSRAGPSQSGNGSKYEPRS